ncbi:hypothetical protein B7494_g4914 [Chlorociboria aeruginascens]|nr:hypothetical protein B7494_g4914 [Chlorociboria aeruginascens]
MQTPRSTNEHALRSAFADYDYDVIPLRATGRSMHEKSQLESLSPSPHRKRATFQQPPEGDVTISVLPIDRFDAIIGLLYRQLFSSLHIDDEEGGSSQSHLSNLCQACRIKPHAQTSLDAAAIIHAKMFKYRHRGRRKKWARILASTNGHSNHRISPNGASPLSVKLLEAAATAFASLVVLGTGFALGGYLYHRFYKWLVLHKMEQAFKPGDPVLELAAMGKQVPNTISDGEDRRGDEHWILRDEQVKIDSIVNGTDRGHYHLLIGEKGTGKSSMLLDAMRKVDAEGCAMFEAHADLEIFRVRLGKALNFEFHEDYIGSYFSERGPRDSTALLDIERAMNKLEKVALKRRQSVGKPLILIINAVHLLRDDADGQDLLELLQQRAEQWAASNLVTMLFNSDDYWVYERMKTLATRMEVMSITDLPKNQAITALKKYRQRYFNEIPSSAVLNEVYNRVGGRLTYLNRVAKSKDMLRTCDDIIDVERRWFLNQCWILGAEMDDDVMDQQKYAAAAMVLANALVKAEDELPEPSLDDGSHNIPQIPLHKAREIMTRADFIQSYDHINLFTITSTAFVRADSVPMQRAFRIICGEDGFAQHLERTLDRIGAIESLGRTREIVAKDLVEGSKYNIRARDGDNRKERITEISLQQKPKGVLPGSSAGDSDVTNTVDAAFTKEVVRKIDFCLLPILFITFNFNFIDKSILSNASVFGLSKDIHLVGNQYSWVSSIFYFGYFLFEYPTTILIQKLLVGKYIAATIIIWGVIVASTAACTSFQGLMMARFFTGMVEATISPAFLYVTSMWYTRDEIPSRMGVWYAGNSVGGAVASLLSYAIGHIDGPLNPWKWLYIMPNGGTQAFSNLVLTGFGFTPLQSTLISLPASFISTTCILVTGYLASKYRNISTILISTTIIPPIIGSPLMNWGPSNGVKLLGYYLLGFAHSAIPLMMSLIGGNVRGTTKKMAVTAGMFIAFCAGNIAGPQLFKKSEAPHYPTAFKAILICYTFASLASLGLRKYLIWVNKRRDLIEGINAGNEASPSIERDEDITDFDTVGFRYRL